MVEAHPKKFISVLLIFFLLAVCWTPGAQGVSVRQLFFEAENCAKALRNSPEKQAYRSYWLACIEKFMAVHHQAPSGPWAAAGLYQAGCLYEDLYRHSYRETDIRTAEQIFERIVREYSKSEYSRRAEQRLKEGFDQPAASIQEIVAKDALAETAPPQTADPAQAAGKAVVTGIRYWSNPDYTRVVIDADQETSFKNNLLNRDPAINKPNQRLYVDLMNSRLGDVEKTLPINDSLLESARAGQYTANTVRVVVDIKSFESYNVFSLRNPFRIVIDVRGAARQAQTDLKKQEVENASIVRQLSLGVRRVVIDPGHGGKDYGAPGFLKGVHEKQVVLQIAKKLAEKVERELNCEVILTRKADTFLTLEERTAIANTQRADLFISLHANASRDQRAAGIETYFLNLTTDNESISVAARENATSEKNISELQTILNDLLQNAKINESRRLATYVQGSLFSHMAKKYSRVHNKGVKRAPFYVLIGAQMPAILIETSFISNKTECKRLADPKYQDLLCDGIVDGIRKYIEATRPTAYFETPVHGDS
jgi:N-acetylmuramoyl-L-alanine amidase